MDEKGQQGLYSEQQPLIPEQPDYPQQPGYPQPAPEYIQQQYAYPQQAYQGYTGQPSTGAPPPYYHQQAQQQTHNVVVVTQQPHVVQPVRYRTGNSDYGTPALVFALVITVFIVFCGCWWSLICSIAGIIFAANASSAGANGNYESAKSQNAISIGCTVTGLVSSIVGIGILLGILFGVVLTNNTYYD